MHPKIDEEVYLEQPKGFKKLDSNGNKLVCKLKNQNRTGTSSQISGAFIFVLQRDFERNKHDYRRFLKN